MAQPSPAELLTAIDRHIQHRDTKAVQQALLQAQDMGLDTNRYTILKKAQQLIQLVDALHRAYKLKDISHLDKTIAKAKDIKYQGPDLDKCIQLRKDIAAIATKAAKVIKKLDIQEMKDIVTEAETMEFVNEDILKMYDILKHKSDDKLLQLQLKAALAEKDGDRVAEITLKLKDIFFEKMGDMFAFNKFPKLRTPSEFADLKLLAGGKEKDQLATRFLWHTTTPIHTSLTSNAPVAEAKKMHKNILIVMGDKKGEKWPREIVAKILAAGTKNPDLRDEIYCQLVKQLTFNESESSREKGWLLMDMCLDSFAPGEDLENYLEMWLRENAPDPTSTLTRLHKAMSGFYSKHSEVMISSERTKIPETVPNEVPIEEFKDMEMCCYESNGQQTVDLED